MFLGSVRHSIVSVHAESGDCLRNPKQHRSHLDARVQNLCLFLGSARQPVCLCLQPAVLGSLPMTHCTAS